MKKQVWITVLCAMPSIVFGITGYQAGGQCQLNNYITTDPSGNQHGPNEPVKSGYSVTHRDFSCGSKAHFEQSVYSKQMSSQVICGIDNSPDQTTLLCENEATYVCPTKWKKLSDGKFVCQ